MTANTSTVDTSATTVEEPTMDNTAALDAETTEAPAEEQANITTSGATDIVATLDTLEQDGASSRELALAAFGDANAAIAGERIAKIMQASTSQLRLQHLLDGLADIESDVSYLPTAANQAEREATAKCARHYIAALLVQSLDQQHNVLRVELCGDEGFGLYAEAGPLGYAGAGIGLVSKEKVNGRTVVKRTGAGVYLRADHLCNKSTPVECSV